MEIGPTLARASIRARERGGRRSWNHRTAQKTDQLTVIITGRNVDKAGVIGTFACNLVSAFAILKEIRD